MNLTLTILSDRDIAELFLSAGFMDRSEKQIGTFSNFLNQSHCSGPPHYKKMFPDMFPGHVPESNILFSQRIRILRAHLVLNFEAGSLLPYNEYLEEHGWSLCFNDVQDCLHI